MVQALPSTRRAAEALSLAGRVALVTGAGQGIGREIARTLAANGARVAVNDVRAERAAAVAAEIRAADGIAEATPADITDFDAVVRLAADVEQRLGPTQILVHNAGNGGTLTDLEDRRPFWETGPADWRAWLDVNLDGLLNLTRACWSGLARSGAGRIVVIGSDAARVGDASLPVYSAAKAGAAGFVRAIARAGGRFGITANCISLAAMDTPAAEAWYTDGERLERLLRAYPVRRLGQPADAAWLALFLVSDAAQWITAQTVPVNGGFSAAL